MKLLIVESPAKAKTISKYLDNKYTVRASVGHIRDLPKSNKDAIDIEKGFVPRYVVSPGKEGVVSEIQKLANKSSEILLATDPDREGEAIAWHVAQAAGIKKPKRIVFHEITQNAVREAMKHPRTIDKHLLKAQEARRVLDRLFGYGLSGLIWKKVRYGLSAGRVQSPALRIIMEREREIRAFIPETFWTITAEAKKDAEHFILTCAEEPRDEKEVKRIIQEGKHGIWHIQKVKETKQKRSPRPPFITSTLQQTASTRLGYAPARTMGIAQKLYEAGLITYMRTDSTTLSKEAQSSAIAFITKEFGKEYLFPRVYKTKSKNAQEAHEAIRPTKIGVTSAGKNPEQKALYDLIRGRTIASQMSDADMLRTKITANIDVAKTGPIPDFSINGSRILFPGWLALDTAARGEESEVPKIQEGDTITVTKLQSEEKQTQPLPRYTEAGLVKELEKRGIGRPSTYASIIKTIIDRGYVEREGRTLFPTDTGDVVSSFLEDHFEEYISDSFTAEMENELDEIASGSRDYVKTLENFYKPFTKDIASKEKMDKITTLGNADKHILCPKCKAAMVIKLGRSGKFLSCSKFPDCTGARTIDGKEMEGPKETGEKCPDCADGKLVEREGRYGKFISCNTYPKCKFIKGDPEEEERAKTGVKCPKCNVGELVARHGRFGEFFSCSNYPKCKYAIKARPTGKLCKECGALMMEGTKTIPERCSEKTCSNHNPHKKDTKK